MAINIKTCYIFLGEFDLMSRGVIVAASKELANQVFQFIKLYPSPRDQPTPVHPFL